MYLFGVKCTIVAHHGRNLDEVDRGVSELHPDTLIPGALVLTIGLDAAVAALVDAGREKYARREPDVPRIDTPES